MSRPASIGSAEISALYRKYGPLVRRRARSILGDDLEAQDATQEVFVRVLASVADFRGASAPSTWLYRITTNLCLNRIRDGRRRRERLMRVTETDVQPLSAPAAPDVQTLLRRVLADLPEDLAEIAIYYHVDEMDQAEIAGLLGVSRRTIGYRLERWQSEAQRILGEPAAAELAEDSAHLDDRAHLKVG